MRIVKRNRYYCDFCKKSGGSAYHMQRHENHCTLNPQRDCRVCAALNGANPEPMATLLALLPDPAPYLRPEGYHDAEVTRVVNAALPALRAAVENCPACILAALRQRQIPVPMATDFDWTKEMKAVWDVVNDANRIGVAL